jgi:hypothetical protein
MPLCGFRVDGRREDAPQHTRDIRVDQRRASLVGERRHGSGRVRTDAWQGAKRCGVCRQLTFSAPAFSHLDRQAV